MRHLQCRRAQRAQVTERRVFSHQRVLVFSTSSGNRAVRCPGVGNRRDLMKNVVLAKVLQCFFFHANEQNKKKRHVLLVQHAPHARVRRARQIVVVLQILPRFPAQERVPPKRTTL